MHIIGKGNWNKTRSKSVRLGKNYMHRESCDVSSSSSSCSSPRWQAFWRRIKMHKKKSFNNNNCSSCVYDAETYMLNFDEGSAGRVEPDNFCRSFSARYAHPSRLSRGKEFMGS
ncbi:hypothetical protein RND71_016298 [Anisodus tanguticus]|uniref:Uncharacterized protein n=1 Tax=Anisodus tanguticus TaxID=243964 RepID=A0AAE1S7Z4_9SOLA|nr:hypothetical protein RND71_016298 [Anisodus tanguticus]